MTTTYFYSEREQTVTTRTMFPRGQDWPVTAQVTSPYGHRMTVEAYASHKHKYVKVGFSKRRPDDLTSERVINFWATVNALGYRTGKQIASTHEIFPTKNFHKEVTESASALLFLCNYLGNERRTDSSVRCWVIGDGISPRTASLVYYYTNWQVTCVDPLLQDKWTGSPFSSTSEDGCLTCLGSKLEDTDGGNDANILISVHGHADLRNFIKRRELKDFILVSIPCCFISRQTLGERVEPTQVGTLPTFNNCHRSSEILLYDVAADGRK